MPQTVGVVAFHSSSFSGERDPFQLHWQPALPQAHQRRVAPCEMARFQTALLLTALLGEMAARTPAAAAPKTHRVALGQAELLVSTGGILGATSNLAFEQHTPAKAGLVLQQEHPWEAGMYFYSSVVQAGSQVMLYYGCSGPANTTANFLCVAVSSDGVSFDKPALGLFAYNGSTANNIVWATPYGPGGHAGTGWSNSVLYDGAPGVAEDERFKLLYDTDDGAFKGRELLLAVSSDGLHWRQLLMSTTANGAVVPRANFGDTCTALLWLPWLGRYAIFGRQDSPTKGATCIAGDSYGNFRQVAMVLESSSGSASDPLGTGASFASRDFNVTPRVIFHTKVGVDPGCVDYYNPSPIVWAGVSFLFPAATRHLNQPGKSGSAFPSPYTSCRTMNDGMLDVRMAFSRLEDPNNLTFHRLSSAPVVARGMGSRSLSSGLFDAAASDWDAGMVFMATGFALLPQEPHHISMYYFGGQVSGIWREQQSHPATRVQGRQRPPFLRSWSERWGRRVAWTWKPKGSARRQVMWVRSCWYPVNSSAPWSCYDVRTA